MLRGKLDDGNVEFAHVVFSEKVVAEMENTGTNFTITRMNRQSEAVDKTCFVQ
jgi:hypothetical protein